MPRRVGLICVAAVAILLFAASTEAVGRGRKPLPRVAVNVSRSSSGSSAVPLKSQTIAGKAYVVVSAKGVRRARVYLDGKVIGRPRLRHHRLTSVALSTSRLRDGSHVVVVKAGRTVRVRFRVSNHGPATGALIASALAHHRIDYGTSLLYRLYAFWGDGRLPSAYRGGTTGEDDDVAIEAAAALEDKKVRGAEARRIRSFLLRPTNPSSAFYVKPPRGKRTTVHAKKKGCDIGPGGTVGLLGVAGSGVILWANDAPGNESLERSFLSEVEKPFAAERADMGTPVGDSPYSCKLANPTSATDIYFLAQGVRLLRDPSAATQTGQLAITVPQCNGARCSSFILVNNAYLRDLDSLRSTLIHEYFHVLQFAHVKDGSQMSNWFTEASAKWAEFHYDQPYPGSDPAALSYWYGVLQEAPDALAHSCEECFESYGSWVFPLFMDQESAGSVAEVWRRIGASGGSSNEAASRAIDAVFPLKDNLIDFAVRNLNQPYHLQGGDTGPRLQDAYPKLDATAPANTTGDPITLNEGDDQQGTTVAPGDLEAWYQPVTVPSSVRYVKLDFSGLPSTVDVAALVHVAGQSEPELRKLSSRQLEFCRDNKDDDIDSMTLVLVNHTTTPTLFDPNASFKYRAAAACPQSVSGTLTMTMVHNDSCDPDSGDGNDHSNWSMSANLDNSLDPTGDNPEEQDNSHLQANGSWHGGGCPGVNPGDPSSATYVGSASGSITGLENAGMGGTNIDYSQLTYPGQLKVSLSFPVNGENSNSDEGTSTVGGNMEVSFLVDIPPSGTGTVTINKQLSYDGDPEEWVGGVYGVYGSPYDFGTDMTVTGTLQVKAKKPGS